mgnify:CR=1 FL=1
MNRNIGPRSRNFASGNIQPTPALTARDVALDAMVRIDDGAFSHVLLPSMLRKSSLSAPDRGQVTALVYGALRARGRCDFLLAQVLDRPLDALEALHTMVGDWRGMVSVLERKVARAYDPVERGELLRRAGSVAEDLLADRAGVRGRR